MNDELVYRASRLKAVLLFLGCAGFVALGLLVSRQKPLLGWACIAFFGLGLPNSYATSRDEILETLNEWPMRYGRAGGQPPPP